MFKTNVVYNISFKFLYKYNLFLIVNILFLIFQWFEITINLYENIFFTLAVFVITPMDTNFVKKDIVFYNKDFLIQKKNYYKELMLIKENFFVFFFILFLSFINMVIYLYFKEPIVDAYLMPDRVESSFPYLFNYLNAPHIFPQFMFFHYGFIFIFIAMFTIIIPVANGTYKFFFKKTLIFLFILMEISFGCAIYSKYFLLEFAISSWTEYLPFNYFLKKNVSLAASFLTLSYFFLIVFHLFLSFIFFYNIFFKRSPYLSFFSVLKSSFFIIIVCFLKIFSLCPFYIFLSCILVSYELKFKLLFWNSSNYDESWWTWTNIHYSFYSPLDRILIISVVAVMFFVIKKQLLTHDDEQRNYKKLIISQFVVWICLIFFSYFLALISRHVELLSVRAQLDLRLVILVISLILLIFFFYKYFRLNFFNPTFICIVVFIFIFMFMWFEILERPLKGQEQWWSIFKFFFFYSATISQGFQGEHFFALMVLWSFFAFFHQYLEYFFWVKLNFKIFQFEFFFLATGTLNILYYIFRIFWADFNDPFIWAGHNRQAGDYFLLLSSDGSISEKGSICYYNYELIFLGFFFTFFFFLLKLFVNKFKKKN